MPEKERTFVEFVEGAAAMRTNQPPVERKYIEEAMLRIARGEEVVQNCYPNGAPSLKEVYDIAARLEAAAATKN